MRLKLKWKSWVPAGNCPTNKNRNCYGPLLGRKNCSDNKLSWGAPLIQSFQSFSIPGFRRLGRSSAVSHWQPRQQTEETNRTRCQVKRKIIKIFLLNWAIFFSSYQENFCYVVDIGHDCVRKYRYKWLDSSDSGNWYFPKADLSFFYFLDFSSIMSNPPILELSVICSTRLPGDSFASTQSILFVSLKLPTMSDGYFQFCFYIV